MSDQTIRKIVIVGGGSAGWMAAAALARMAAAPGREITLVESSEIGTVGVGEATLPTLRFFNQSLGIDEVEFIKATQASFKLGVQFRDWSQLGRTFFHGFGDFGPPIRGVSPHHHWLRTRAADDLTSYEDSSIATVAARQNRFAPPLPERRSVLGSYSYAFHFDAGLYAAFLRRFAEQLGVRRIEGRVVEVRQRSEDGFISALRLEDGREIEGELFVDCSGFAGLLIEKTLEAGFDDWSALLPCDRAWAVPCEAGGDGLTPYTRSTARSAGWQWRIPLQHRTGNGHVFCSAFEDEGRAAETLMAGLDGRALAEPKLLKFVTGRRRRSWVKNCVALGLASGFTEPLESTSINLIETGVGRLIELFPDRRFDPVLAEEYNRLTADQYEGVRDFLVLHYRGTSRTDTPFWRACQELPLPDRLAHQIEVWKAGGKVVLYDRGSFAEPSWVSIYLGHGMIPRRWDPLADLVPEAQLRDELAHRRRIVAEAAASLSLHADFIGKHCRARAEAA